MDAIIFIVLICLSALFSGAETALFSLRESQVRLMVKRKEVNGEIIARLKNDPHRLLVTILTGNTLVTITIGSLSTLFAIDHAESLGLGVIAGLSTLTILLFGEIFPKSVAIMYNKLLAQILAYPIYACYLVLYPVSTIFVWIEMAIKRITNAPLHGRVTEEEIRIMSDIGLEHG